MRDMDNDEPDMPRGWREAYYGPGPEYSVDGEEGDPIPHDPDDDDMDDVDSDLDTVPEPTDPMTQDECEFWVDENAKTEAQEHDRLRDAYDRTIRVLRKGEYL